MGTAPCSKTRPTEMSFSRDSKTNVHARTAGRYRYAIPGDETPRDLLYDVVLTVYKLFSVNDATINAGTVTDSPRRHLGRGSVVKDSFDRGIPLDNSQTLTKILARTGCALLTGRGFQDDIAKGKGVGKRSLRSHFQASGPRSAIRCRGLTEWSSLRQRPAALHAA